MNPDGTWEPEAWDRATVDHVIPSAAGGCDDESNLVSACRLCNCRRGYEYQKGLPEGAMLGKWKPNGTSISKPKEPKYSKPPKTRNGVCLTGDEKKAIMAGNLGSVPGINAVRIQRDQALSQIGILRKEIDSWKPVITAQADQIKELRKQVEDQEEELKSFRSITVWKMFRKILAEWIKP